MQKGTKETTSALVRLSQKYGIEESKLVETLRATVIKSKKIKGRDGKPDTWVPASIEEVNAGLMIAAQYDLDPLLKQIHFFPAEGGGIVPIVGYDGWVKLVNREKRFAGFSSVDNLDQANNLVSCTGTMKIFNSPDGNPALGTYEVSVTEYLEECRRDTEPWRKWPRRMLRNKTYSQTARMAFGFSGIYDEDEGERILEAQEIDITPTVRVPQALPKASSSTTSGAPKGQNTEKSGEPISHEAGSGSTISGTPPSPSSGGGDKAGAAAAPASAGGYSNPPKTDAQKKEFILAIATKAAGVFGVAVNQVIYDLSKFVSKKEGKPDEEVGATGIDDPRLTSRWLNKTYGEAKKLEEQLDKPF